MKRMRRTGTGRVGRMAAIGLLFASGVASGVAAALAAGFGAGFVVASGGVAHAQTVQGEDVRSRLERALDDYEEAEREADRDARIAGFRRAEQGFAALLADGIATPALQTNLGNAALQAGDLGAAVLAYRRALRLDPAAMTARQNLAHVRSLLPAWVPRPSGSEGADALLVYRRIPESTRSLLAAGSFALAALFVVVAARRRDGPWRGLAILFGIVWALLLASVVVDGSGGEGVAAVVMADETVARSSDAAQAKLAFPDPLPQGVEVVRLEVRGDFARIRLANGRDVWVRSGSVTPVDD